MSGEVFDYEELLKATQSFSQSRLIGQGSHGSVYKAVLEDRIVSIKRATINGSEYLQENFKKLENEIRILSSLQKNRNPSNHVINFLGTSSQDDTSSKVLVMEFMPNGSLYDLLHNNAGADEITPPRLLGWPDRVKIAMQVAKAIQLLHENDPVVIHRDVKSSNILFDSNWDAKLADFGLAVSESEDSSKIQPAGTIGYLDPCYTNPSILSKKIDVYSYGVVLLEIISCRKAIDVARTPASIVDWAIPLIKEEKFRKICDSRVDLPSSMEGVVKQMLHVAARCVSSEKANRPGIGEISMAGSSFSVSHQQQIERARSSSSVPIWVMSFLGSMIRIRQRKSGKLKACSQKKMVVTLREVLAEAALK